MTKKVLSLSTFLFLFIHLSAQTNFEVQWGEKLKTSDIELIFDKQILSTNTNYFALTSLRNGTSRFDRQIVQFNLDHEMEWNKDLHIKRDGASVAIAPGFISTSEGTFAY